MLPVKQMAETIFHAFYLLHFYLRNCLPFATVTSTYTGIALLAANFAYFNVLVSK